MAKIDISTKRLAISKANAQMVGVVAAASFITVFCLVASKTVLSQNIYQSHVISKKEQARNQLNANLDAFDSLVDAYKKFDGASNNVLGGSKSGTGDNDGTNSKIILDSLPSTYDFPALTSSIEKILNDNSLQVSSITGTDDQINQQGNTSSPSPEAVEIPFSFTVKNASYESAQRLVKALQQSIRPIQVDTLDLSGGSGDMTITVTGHTYYQPAKSVNITKKVVK